MKLNSRFKNCFLTENEWIVMLEKLKIFIKLYNKIKQIKIKIIHIYKSIYKYI